MNQTLKALITQPRLADQVLNVMPVPYLISTSETLVIQTINAVNLMRFGYPLVQVCVCDVSRGNFVDLINKCRELLRVSCIEKETFSIDNSMFNHMDGYGVFCIQNRSEQVDVPTTATRSNRS